MPERTVYLHVGAPKTGTTYLQDRLELNRHELAKHGVHYPLGLSASQFKAALDLIEMPWGGLGGDRVKGEWDALIGRVRRLSGTVVVSHEILAAARRRQIDRALSDLQGSELHLVYSARDLARQIPAEWQEGLKHHRHRSFARFLALVQRTRQTHSKLWFWRVQGLPDVIGRWSKGLPPERIHLVTVPQAGPRDLLWRRYCTVFGIRPEWAPADSVRENVSVGIAESALLRRLNRRLPRPVLDNEDYRQLVRRLMVEETLARRPRMTRATLPPEAFGWATAVAEEWIGWIQRSGIHVVGDLDDLRPLPPPENERWHDPDRPRRPEMVDAALDALSAMILEAARRPDPDAQLRARLGRVARRLRGQ